MNKLFFLASAALLPLADQALATNYNVGPGQPLATLSAVPWATLQPGDFVNIHYKPGGYHEKIQISASGTAAQHIVVRGIPDPTTGALPIVDGQDAVEDPSIDWRGGNDNLSDNGVIAVTPRHAGYIYGVTHVRYLDIETLDVRNASYSADGSITYTNKLGVVRGYSPFAAGIYVEWALDFAVRGCEISNCGIGFFANSKNLQNQSSQRLLIEKNYFHDNSNPPIPNPNDPNGTPLSNGFGEHHIYTESAGCIIQFNRFGKLRPGAHGTAIKDRSSGAIIRYNEFVMNGQSNVIALPNVQGGSGFIDLQSDYRDAHFYGNLVTIEDYSGPHSVALWGAFDGAPLYAVGHRGTLHFYNNTIVNHHDGVALFLLPGSNYTSHATITNPTYENVDFRNNIIYSDTEIQASVHTALRFVNSGTTDGGGDIVLGTNWISPGWSKTAFGQTWSGALTGTANLIVGDASGVNDPRFINITTRDYHVLSPSNILDAGGPLNTLVPPALAVTQEYVFPQSLQSRMQQGVAMDLGALESTGLAITPPPGGALQFSIGAYSRTESGSTATISVTRVGGNTGAVGVSYTTTGGGTAIEGMDYTGVVGTLAWADGDSALKTFTVPVSDDAEIEVAETVSLMLFGPTGGAILGTLDTALLTIQDSDTPPSALMYALGNTSDALFLFQTSTPGTPLSFSLPSGLVAGDSLRALAVQPVTGRLYAMGTAGVLYTLNPFTGAAAAVGSAISPSPTGSTMDLTFDRVTGMLRLFTGSGQNLVIHPATGSVVSTDAAPAYAMGDVNAAFTPLMVGADFAFSSGTQTLHGIDAARDTFVNIPSPAAAQFTTLGPLGHNIEPQGALEIPEGATFAWACLTLQGAAGSGLYAIHLNKGNAILIGAIRNVEQVRDMVIAPPHDVWKQARFGTNAGNEPIGGDEADPDGNGVSNLMEYALGAQLGSSSTDFMPVAGNTGSYLTLSFNRPTSANDVIYTVQVSDDLTTWHNGSVYSPYGDTPTNAHTTEASRSVVGGIETIVIRDNAAINTFTQRFMRLQVTAP